MKLVWLSLSLLQFIFLILKMILLSIHFFLNKFQVSTIYILLFFLELIQTLWDLIYLWVELKWILIALSVRYLEIIWSQKLIFYYVFLGSFRSIQE